MVSELDTAGLVGKAVVEMFLHDFAAGSLGGWLVGLMEEEAYSRRMTANAARTKTSRGGRRIVAICWDAGAEGCKIGGCEMEG